MHHYRKGSPVTTNNPQVLTVRGRLSWPTWTYAEALKRNTTSKFPKKDEDVRPNFSLLLGDGQAGKLVNHLLTEFIPWGEAQDKAGEKSGITPAHAKKLKKILNEADWEVDGVLGLIRAVHEKSADLAPEAVMAVSINGFKGRDLERKAIVKDEDQLKVNDGTMVIPPRGLILPVEDTKLELYPGSIVAATINLFAFTAAGNPGITASTGAAIFAADADRFGGGGGEIDEDSIFMEDEDL